MNIRGITISVGYGPLLAVTLPRAMRHLSECLVVTTPDDDETHIVASRTPGVRVLTTDAFTRHGARFNKGLGMEEGFDTLGREGWILIFDADIVMPDILPAGGIKPDCLYGARRRILPDPSEWSDDLEWRSLPMLRDGGPIGFFQCFHATALKGRRPWYDVSFAHAGGGDAYFMTHWTRDKWTVLPIDVLHLGLPDKNWFGLDETGRDMMDAFVHRNGWRRAMPRADPSAVERVGMIPERVSVPGYDASTFELPFVNRTRHRPT